MAYATIADVQRLEAQRAINANSKPSLDDVTNFLEDTAVEIDGTLEALGYVQPVPTTATQAFRLLQRMNAKGAFALVQQAAAEDSRRKESLLSWQEALAAMRDGKVELPGAPRQSAGALKIRVRPTTSEVATSWFTREMEW